MGLRMVLVARLRTKSKARCTMILIRQMRNKQYLGDIQQVMCGYVANAAVSIFLRSVQRVLFAATTHVVTVPHFSGRSSARHRRKAG